MSPVRWTLNRVIGDTLSVRRWKDPSSSKIAGTRAGQKSLIDMALRALLETGVRAVLST
jgi:hypothetical protein